MNADNMLKPLDSNIMICIRSGMIAFLEILKCCLSCQVRVLFGCGFVECTLLVVCYHVLEIFFRI